MSHLRERMSSQQLSSFVQSEVDAHLEEVEADDDDDDLLAVDRRISQISQLIAQETEQAARHKPSMIIKNPRKRQLLLLGKQDDPYPVQTEIGSEARNLVVRWLYEVCLEQNWPLETLFAVRKLLPLALHRMDEKCARTFIIYVMIFQLLRSFLHQPRRTFSKKNNENFFSY